MAKLPHWKRGDPITAARLDAMAAGINAARGIPHGMDGAQGAAGDSTHLRDLRRVELFQITSPWLRKEDLCNKDDVISTAAAKRVAYYSCDQTPLKNEYDANDLTRTETLYHVGSFPGDKRSDVEDSTHGKGTPKFGVGDWVYATFNPQSGRWEILGAHEDIWRFELLGDLAEKTDPDVPTTAPAKLIVYNDTTHEYGAVDDVTFTVALFLDHMSGSTGDRGYAKRLADSHIDAGWEVVVIERDIYNPPPGTTITYQTGTTVIYQDGSILSMAGCIQIGPGGCLEAGPVGDPILSLEVDPVSPNNVTVSVGDWWDWALGADGGTISVGDAGIWEWATGSTETHEDGSQQLYQIGHEIYIEDPANPGTYILFAVIGTDGQWKIVSTGLMELCGGMTICSTGSITAESGSTVDVLSGSIWTWATGSQLNLEHDAADDEAPLKLVPAAGRPAAPAEGNIWLNSTTAKFEAQEDGEVKDVIASTNRPFYTYLDSSGTILARTEAIAGKIVTVPVVLHGAGQTIANNAFGAGGTCTWATSGLPDGVSCAAVPPALAQAQYYTLTNIDWGAADSLLDDDAVPVGFIFKWNRQKSAGATVNAHIQLVLNGALIGTEKTSTYPGSAAQESLGSASDLWGTSGLTMADLKDNDFGVAIDARSTDQNLNATINDVELDVYF